jgi:hypothetical protein
MASQTVPELEFSGLHNNGGKFISPHLRTGITIYPLQDNNPFAVKRGAGMRQINWQKESAATVMSLSWTKQLGQASGRWTATIKPKHSGIQFRDPEILDGDWADLSVLRNGIQIPVCRGVVDTVRESGSVINGATATTYTLTGRDHGAFFEYPITFNNPFARDMEQLMNGFMTSRLNAKQNGRPDQLFAALIDGWFKGDDRSGAGQWELPQSFPEKFPLNSKGNLEPARLAATRASFGPTDAELRNFNAKGRLTDVLKIVTFDAISGTEGLRGFIGNTGLWSVGEQNLHQTLSQWVNPLLNEWWYDLVLPQAFVPKNALDKHLSVQTDLFKARTSASQAAGGSENFGVMAALIRERPFLCREKGIDGSMWSGLPTWTIPTWLVSSSDLGIGGAERFNVFHLLAEMGFGSGIEQTALGKPRWLRSDIAQRGLRSTPTEMSSTKYIPLGAEGEWFKERADWLALMQDWYAANPYLRQGTITVNTLLPEIRVGQRVILSRGDPQQAEQFYVEGVTLTYNGPIQNAGASGSTTLIVTRGFRGDDRTLFTAMSDLASQYEESLIEESLVNG